MTTARALINRAFILAKITAAGETPSAEDAADALDTFNEMLHSWGLEYGIELGHSDLALGDTITLPDSHIKALRYNLAIHLASEYEVGIDAAVVSFAERGLRALQAQYVNLPELEFDGALTSRNSTRSGTETF